MRVRRCYILLFCFSVLSWIFYQKKKCLSRKEHRLYATNNNDTYNFQNIWQKKHVTCPRINQKHFLLFDIVLIAYYGLTYKKHLWKSCNLTRLLWNHTKNSNPFWVNRTFFFMLTHVGSFFFNAAFLTTFCVVG